MTHIHDYDDGGGFSPEVVMTDFHITGPCQAAYARGCRCQDCRTAWREASRRRGNKQPSQLVLELDAAAAHVDALRKENARKSSNDLLYPPLCQRRSFVSVYNGKEGHTMAALFWHSSQRQLSNGQPIASFNQFLANIMNNHGFANTRGNQQEAAGGKNGCWVSVGHFPISGALYWEIVMASGADGPTTQATVNEVVSLFSGIAQL